MYIPAIHSCCVTIGTWVYTCYILFIGTWVPDVQVVGGHSLAVVHIRAFGRRAGGKEEAEAETPESQSDPLIIYKQ